MKTFILVTIILASSVGYSETKDNQITSVERCSYYNDLFVAGDFSAEVGNSAAACLCGVGNVGYETIKALGKTLGSATVSYLTDPVVAWTQTKESFSQWLAILGGIKNNIIYRTRVYGTLTNAEQSAMLCEGITQVATLGLAAGKLAQIGRTTGKVVTTIPEPYISETVSPAPLAAEIPVLRDVVSSKQLLTLEEYEALPPLTNLVSVTGENVTKGIHDIYLGVSKGGHIGYRLK